MGGKPWDLNSSANANPLGPTVMRCTWLLRGVCDQGVTTPTSDDVGNPAKLQLRPSRSPNIGPWCWTAVCVTDRDFPIFRIRSIVPVRGRGRALDNVRRGWCYALPVAGLCGVLPGRRSRGVNRFGCELRQYGCGPPALRNLDHSIYTNHETVHGVEIVPGALTFQEPSCPRT